jgi:hypothetical protein
MLALELQFLLCRGKITATRRLSIVNENRPFVATLATPARTTQSRRPESIHAKAEENAAGGAAAVVVDNHHGVSGENLSPIRPCDPPIFARRR